MEIIELAVVGALNLLCFLLGARVAKTPVRRESAIHQPDPMASIRANQARKQINQHQKALETMLGNIECYDGTPLGQKDIPGGD